MFVESNYILDFLQSFFNISIFLDQKACETAYDSKEGKSGPMSMQSNTIKNILNLS